MRKISVNRKQRLVALYAGGVCTGLTGGILLGGKVGFWGAFLYGLVVTSTVACFMMGVFAFINKQKQAP